jgi:hypothetical protein
VNFDRAAIIATGAIAAAANKAYSNATGATATANRLSKNPRRLIAIYGQRCTVAHKDTVARTAG